MRRSESVTSSTSPTLKTSSLSYAKKEFTNEGDEVIGAACTVRFPSVPRVDIHNRSTSITTCSMSICNSSSSSAEVVNTGRGNDDTNTSFCGTILEVRELYRANTPSRLLSSSNSTTADHLERPKRKTKLYAYVRRKDGDHRNGGWFPTSWVQLTNNPQYVINHVHLNPIYTTITTGMSQTMRSEKELDYLEERLSRDCKSPTCVRYFVYLNKFIFAPWYYAPYGLLNSEFDPLQLILTTSSVIESSYSSPSAQLWSFEIAESESKNNNYNIIKKSDNRVQDTKYYKHNATVNPYIRDAYLCPFSLRVYSSYNQMSYETQMYRANRLHPPGEEIYRDDERHFSLFEINGSNQLTYCRHLFLLGKSFLENKLAGHDVHNYFFYVFCLHHCYYPEYVNDDSAMYFAGYFTWEKQVAEHNLACIVTLPCFAGCSSNQEHNEASSSSFVTPTLKGIGQFMIATSYELARRRHHVGSPEKPLSDLGAIAYERYWQEVIIRWMNDKLHALQKPTAAIAKETNKTEEVMFDVDNDNAVSVRKRPRSDCTEYETDLASTKEETNSNAMKLQTDWEEQMSLTCIGKQTGLEEADVLRILLAMGLLHRNAETRTLRLVIPPEFVQRQMALYTRRASSLQYAAFDKQLLLSPLLKSKSNNKRKKSIPLNV